MHHVYRRLSLCGVALIALSSCATHAAENPSEDIAKVLSDPRVGEKVASACMSGSMSFSDETANSVVVRRSMNDRYLLIMKSCPDLEFAQTMFSAGPARCLRRNGSLRISRSVLGPTIGDMSEFNRCYIDSIHKWNPEALEVEVIQDDKSDARHPESGHTFNQMQFPNSPQSD